MWKTLFALTLVLIPLSACGEAPLATGVQHLDPRLPDGRAAADVLSEQRILFASWTVESSESELAPWRLHEPCVRYPARDGAKGMIVSDVETEPGVFPRIRLSWEGSVHARDFNVFELDMRKYHRSSVRLSWRLASDPQDDEDRHGIDLILAANESTESVAISLEGHEDWRGDVTRLTLTPCAEGPQVFEFSAMRFVQVGLTAGADLLGRENQPRNAGDGGLIALGEEARRCWPSDWDVPLFCEATALPGSLLTVDTAIPKVLADSADELHFAIDLRTPSTKWIEVAERSIVPRDALNPTAWFPLLADLTPWLGEELSIRFRNFRVAAGDEGEPSIGLGGTLQSSRAYWGAPMVVSSLKRERQPNVVLVTVDTLRADSVGKRTPFLDRMRREGQHFTNAWAASNSTSPSHASILTGLHALDHGVVDNYSILAAENQTLAELLRNQGYHTAGAVSVRHLEPSNSGLGQGMDQFLLAVPRSSMNGGLTLEAVQAWLREWREIGDRPFFLWVHFFDAHTPYQPPESFLEAHLAEYELEVPPKVGTDSIPESRFKKKGQFLHDVSNLEHATFMYDACVSYADLLISELWGTVEELEWEDDTLLVVTADHGESLGEHGKFFEHTDVLQHVMQVPLLTLIPDERGGSVIEEPVSTVDLAATLAARLGLTGEFRGHDLFGARDVNRRLFFASRDLQQLGLCDGDFYFVSAQGESQLFDRQADPRLTRDLAGEKTELVERYEQALRKWRESALERPRKRRELTEQQMLDLLRLGYTAPGDL